MIKIIHDGGYTNTAAERVLQLPFGTFQKWLDQPDQLDAASLAMLRLIAQHPGILAASEKS
jgi:DNA-binding transcriptional regulator YiaG